MVTHSLAAVSLVPGAVRGRPDDDTKRFDTTPSPVAREPGAQPSPPDACAPIVFAYRSVGDVSEGVQVTAAGLMRLLARDGWREFLGIEIRQRGATEWVPLPLGPLLRSRCAVARRRLTFGEWTMEWINVVAWSFVAGLFAAALFFWSVH